MGFLDDVKKGANSLSESINSSVKGTQTKHQASSLLHDLGVLSWKSRTGQTGADDATELARIEGELAELVAAGTVVDLTLKTAAPPPPPPPRPRRRPPPPAPPAAAGAARLRPPPPRRLRHPPRRAPAPPAAAGARPSCAPGPDRLLRPRHPQPKPRPLRPLRLPHRRRSSRIGRVLHPRRPLIHARPTARTELSGPAGRSAPLHRGRLSGRSAGEGQELVGIAVELLAVHQVGVHELGVDHGEPLDAIELLDRDPIELGDLEPRRPGAPRGGSASARPARRRRWR